MGLLFLHSLLACGVATLGVRSDDQPVRNAPAKTAFRALGDLEGGESLSEVSGISADGSTVVGWSSSAISAEGWRQAFKWTAKDGMVALPDLEGGIVRSNAGAATRDGALIVGDSMSDEGSQAALWNADLEVVALGSLGGDEPWATARGISEDGRFVVGCSTSPRGYEAFLWERDKKGLVALGDAPGGAFNSSAQTVSPRGDVIFGCASVPAGVHVFRWTHDGGMKVLGDLAGGGDFSEPYAATSNGRICVGRAQSAASGADHYEAFRWSADADDPQLEALGDLEGGAFDSWALGVSDDGATIVGFGTTALGQEAMIWTQEDGMRRLAELIDADERADIAGWTLTYAAAISADGKTITGHGRDPAGNVQGWVWTVPAKRDG